MYETAADPTIKSSAEKSAPVLAAVAAAYYTISSPHQLSKKSFSKTYYVVITLFSCVAVAEQAALARSPRSFAHRLPNPGNYCLVLPGPRPPRNTTDGHCSLVARTQSSSRLYAESERRRNFPSIDSPQPGSPNHSNLKPFSEGAQQSHKYS